MLAHSPICHMAPLVDDLPEDILKLLQKDDDWQDAELSQVFAFLRRGA